MTTIAEVNASIDSLYMAYCPTQDNRILSGDLLESVKDHRGVKVTLARINFADGRVRYRVLAHGRDIIGKSFAQEADARTLFTKWTS